jgi:hypothetical protein
VPIVEIQGVGQSLSLQRRRVSGVELAARFPRG